MTLQEQVIAQLEETNTGLLARNNELHTIIVSQIAKINELETKNRQMMVELDRYETGIPA